MFMICLKNFRDKYAKCAKFCNKEAFYKQFRDMLVQYEGFIDF